MQSPVTFGPYRSLSKLLAAPSNAPSDLDGLINPQFVWPIYMNMFINYENHSSVTILDTDSYSKNCNYYGVTLSDYSVKKKTVLKTFCYTLG